MNSSPPRFSPACRGAFVWANLASKVRNTGFKKIVIRIEKSEAIFLNPGAHPSLRSAKKASPFSRVSSSPKGDELTKSGIKSHILRLAVQPDFLAQNALEGEPQPQGHIPTMRVSGAKRATHLPRQGARPRDLYIAFGSLSSRFGNRALFTHLSLSSLERFPRIPHTASFGSYGVWGNLRCTAC